MKNFLKTVVGIALFIAIAIGILTVLRNFNRQPSAILTSTECDPPCWYAIQPGKTNSSELPTLLEQIGLRGEEIIWDFDKNDKLISINWFFHRPVEDSAGFVYFDEDKQVTATTILTINSLSIADIFGKLGEPDEYWTEIGKRENQEYLEVFLLYPTKGYLVDCVINIENGSDQVEIKPVSPVFRVTYFDPKAYQDLLETRILIDKSVHARTGSPQPWQGLGIIPIERK